MITEQEKKELKAYLGIDKIQKSIELLNDKVNQNRQTTVNELSALREYKANVQMENQIKQILLTQGELYSKVEVLKGQVAGFTNSKKYIEIFTDKEIYDLYDKSGMQLKEVAAKFNVTVEMASRYVQGEVQDPIIRSNIGIWLRNEIAKK